jgi:hypothetical protein
MPPWGGADGAELIEAETAAMVHILHNHATITSVEVNGYQIPYALTQNIKVSQGDVIDIIQDSYSSVSYSSSNDWVQYTGALLCTFNSSESMDTGDTGSDGDMGP